MWHFDRPGPRGYAFPQGVRMDVFVTGAGRGLGLSFTKLLLEQGHRVIAGHLGARKGLDALPGRGRIFPVPLDVRVDASVKDAARAAAEITQSLDMVINNAGIFPAGYQARAGALDFSLFHECYDVNAMGPLRVIKALLPLLERGVAKTLVTISSEAGSIGGCGSPDRYAYSMSKAALDMAMKILGNDLAPKGFSILIIHPGWLQTDMGRATGEPDVPPDQAAAEILALAFARKKETLGRLVDRKGTPMPW